MTDLEKCLERVRPDIITGCWYYTGAMTSSGYGNIRLSCGKNDLAHRVVYKALRGPIPAKFDLDHLCRHRCCVSPNHLEAVPHRVNMRRSKAASKTHCKHGHPYDFENTGYQSGARYCRTCLRLKARRRYHAIHDIMHTALQDHPKEIAP